VTGAVRVVVLCHANVARSVAAAHLLEGATDERGVVIELRSAGTHASDGQPASARTRAALEARLGELGLLAAHRSHLLDLDDVEWADLVIAMEGSQVRFVRRLHPDAAPRTATVAVLASSLPRDGRALTVRIASMDLAARPNDDDDDDVVDPAGGDDVVYARTIDDLIELCGRLRERLAG
jgi:protein-tyrosine phosphatase